MYAVLEPLVSQQYMLILHTLSKSLATNLKLSSSQVFRKKIYQITSSKHEECKKMWALSLKFNEHVAR
jgi:hypothetical protein